MAISTAFLREQGLLARAMRSSAWTLFGFGAAQVVRLGSNLILTRLLYPEAFGLMTLVTVALVALANFSDLGIGPAIAHNKRGDDPDFLDTAWTLQVVRGVILFLALWALAWPISWFYREPMLIEILPVAGLVMLIGGFTPTSLETAHRHLLLGRVTLIDLLSSVIGIVVMVAIAIVTRSIWSLVAGSIVNTIARIALIHLFLPNSRNRFRWEPEASRELVHFGKWIFVSTICGFMVAQGDRVVLGRYLSLELLGIYNVAYIFATFPLMLGGAVVGRILIPLYRERPPSASRENFEKFRILRLALTGAMVTMLLVVATFGVPLVTALYDPRFHAAGPIVVLLACVQIPQVIIMTYDQSALAAGDSRRFFLLMAPKAVLLTLGLLAGIHQAGLVGALCGQALATVLAYPLVVRLARRFGVWDPLHDLLFTGMGLAGTAIVIAANAEAMRELAMLQ